jgi:hypothetical protein
VPLSLWTIYDRPADYPDGFLARRFENDQPSDDVLVGTLEALRRYFLERGLVCVTADPEDDPVIVETWF